MLQALILKLTSFSAAFDHQTLQYGDLGVYQDHYFRSGDFAKAAYYQRLLATADGQFDFSQQSLNDAVNNSPYVDVQPLRFSQWLATIWDPSP